MSAGKHAVLVYNPAARSAADPDLWLGRVVHRLCEEGGYRLTVAPTRPDPAEPPILTAGEPAPDIVVAAGGDGTVRQVLQAVRRSCPRVPVGIIPAGTGNQLARNLGIYEDSLLKDPVEEAVSIILSGSPQAIDLGDMNGHLFAVAAGAGPLSDAVIIPGRQDKTNWKMLAYASSMVQTFAMPPVVFKVTADGSSFSVTASGIFAANVGDLGVGQISETAEPNDGLLDLCILNPSRFTDYLNLGFRFAGGFVGGEAPYYIRKARQIDIEVVPVPSRLSAVQRAGLAVRSFFKGVPAGAPPIVREVTAMIDGDACGTTPMRITVLPQAVSVVVRQLS